jgi:hypothetical protein
MRFLTSTPSNASVGGIFRHNGIFSTNFNHSLTPTSQAHTVSVFLTKAA